MVLGRKIIEFTGTVANQPSRRDASGRISVVGKCFVSGEVNHKQRKTRKACKS